MSGIFDFQLESELACRVYTLEFDHSIEVVVQVLLEQHGERRDREAGPSTRRDAGHDSDAFGDDVGSEDLRDLEVLVDRNPCI